MPTLNLVTNVKIPDAKAFALKFSKFGAETLGKPEAYISVIVNYNETLTFAGTFDPAFSLRIDSLDNINPEANERYTKAFAKFFEDNLGAKDNRGYVTFIDPGRANIGFQSTTFATIFAEQSESDTTRRDALCACTYVSRSFSHRARHHLFHKIKLHDDINHDISSRLSSLHKLLSWPSKATLQPGRSGIGRLTQHVKEFAFHLSNTEKGVDHVMLEYDKAGTLTSILNALHGPDHGITKFVLFLHWQSVNYACLSDNLRCAFLALVRSPRLRYLRICNLNGLPTNFLVNSHIKHLHLYECMAEDEIIVYPPVSPVRPSHYPELESLDTDHELPLTYFENPEHVPSIARPGVCSSSFTHLRTVSLAVLVVPDFDDVMTILSRIEDTLEHLTLRYYVIETPLAPEHPFDLTRHSNLRHLCLYHNGGLTLSSGPGIALDDIVLMLYTIKLPPSLSTLELVIILEGENNTPELFLEFFLAHQWGGLDAVLSESSFSAIRKLILTLHFGKLAAGNAVEPPIRKHIKTFLKVALSAVSANKTLNLVINVVFSVQEESWTPRTVDGLSFNEGDE
ncbi:hypothetical protein NLJ89_g3569 [Agrocybe chaxingu]|uniref:L-dopachrome isomerase n=1 Tax=Agrocybe chaxingu TaxID=84603 RepID=A0A9W8K3R1_9AGAR|nr:hypothetical protein NLJ89_g3569 [Agrocybe chaxingu]